MFFEVVTDREWWIREHAPIDLFEKKIVMTFGAARSADDRHGSFGLKSGHD